MSRIISVWVDEAAEARLDKLAREIGRSVEDLAECAVSEAALNSFRGRDDDPATPAGQRDRRQGSML